MSNAKFTKDEMQVLAERGAGYTYQGREMWKWLGGGKKVDYNTKKKITAWIPDIDTDQANEVVTGLRKSGWRLALSDVGEEGSDTQWMASFIVKGKDVEHVEFGPTLAKAICRAALTLLSA